MNRMLSFTRMLSRKGRSAPSSFAGAPSSSCQVVMNESGIERGGKEIKSDFRHVDIEPQNNGSDLVSPKNTSMDSTLPNQIPSYSCNHNENKFTPRLRAKRLLNHYKSKIIKLCLNHQDKHLK
ncbi:hypothetical protein YC2023_005739 [Brassica napus]